LEGGVERDRRAGAELGRVGIVGQPTEEALDPLVGGDDLR
jgi:hypothetical protein